MQHLLKGAVCFTEQHHKRSIYYRSSLPKVHSGKDVLKICSKITGGHPCRNVVSMKLLCNFIEITFRHECSPVNLLIIFRALCPKNTSGGLLLELV